MSILESNIMLESRGLTGSTYSGGAVIAEGRGYCGATGVVVRDGKLNKEGGGSDFAALELGM